MGVTGTSPDNYGTLVPGFPVSATFSVDDDGEYLVIRVTGNRTQSVIVLGYSLNGAPETYSGKWRLYIENTLGNPLGHAYNIASCSFSS